MRILVKAGKSIGNDGAGTAGVAPFVLIEEGRIAAIGSQFAEELPAADRVLDAPDATLAPAFFDVHIHGSAGRDVMEATPEALATVGSFLATRGVGSYLATTVTAPIDPTLKALAGLATELARYEADPGLPGARPLGIHLEGPFLSHAKRGVHPAEHLQVADTALFDRFWQAAEGRIRLLTLAPEIPGATELARHATRLGARVSMGHSNADAATTRAAIAAGATTATHTFNAMRPLDHREIGILGTVLTTDTLYAELICDGIHVDPALVKLWWRAKGRDRGILITDAMSAAGMPDGEYMLGEFAVQVAQGRATANGVLAGSVLTLDRALENFIAFSGASLEDAIQLVTANPARMTGLGLDMGLDMGLGSAMRKADRAADDAATGRGALGHPSALSQGGRADLVLLDSAGALIASIIGGQVVGGQVLQAQPAA